MRTLGNWRGRRVAAGVTSGDPEAAVRLDARAAAKVRYGLAFALVVIVGGAYALLPGLREESGRALTILSHGDIPGIKAYILSYGVWAPIISSALMLLQAVISPLPAFLLTFANGLAFGAFWGGVLSVVSTTVAAGACFLLARVIGRAPMEALLGGARLADTDRWFARWGAHAVLIARLIPFMSVDLISYAAGLTRMRLRPFMIATLIGILPSTFLYSYLGARATEYVLVLVAVNVGIAVAAAGFALRRKVRGKERGDRGKAEG
jgi:uncharacterized membrane protein YdjX (TVP38/TMEM64 family)